MSEKHLYLSLIPQALIASMLPPEEFGSYYAVGTKVHVRGEAIFFELDPDFRSDDFPFHIMDERCVAKADGSPKSSVYLSIYQALDKIPISALGNLYLVTDDGRTLEIPKSEYAPAEAHQTYLYQEFYPINPLVASTFEPHEFSKLITNPDSPVSVPRIVFSDLILGGLADDPLGGAADDLPYPSIQHLRDVLSELKAEHKASKLVLKQVKQGVLFRTINRGFYVGDKEDFAFYRFPTRDQLNAEYHVWWRSAQTSSLF